MKSQRMRSEAAKSVPEGEHEFGLSESMRAMQEHFYRNGYFRPEDVTRVLGNPRETVEVTAGVGLPAAARIEK